MVEVELNIFIPKTISKEEYKRSLIDTYPVKKHCKDLSIIGKYIVKKQGKNPEILRMMKNG